MLVNILTKGKVSLDEIIKNILVSCQINFWSWKHHFFIDVSKLPKSDSNLNKINDKQKIKSLIFCGHLILNEEQIIENFHLNKTSVKNEPKVEPKSNNILMIYLH